MRHIDSSKAVSLRVLSREASGTPAQRKEELREFDLLLRGLRNVDRHPPITQIDSVGTAEIASARAQELKWYNF